MTILKFPISNQLKPATLSNTTDKKLESRKVLAKYWSADGVFYYCMEINKVSVCRRSVDSYVNGTKLLNAANLTRGRRDGLLKKITDKYILRNGIAALRGVWIPLHVAQEFARMEDLEDVSYPLLEDDLEDAFKNNPDFVNAINKKIKNIKDHPSKVADTLKTTSTINEDIVNSLKENVSTDTLMNFVKSEHSQINNPIPVDLKVTKMPTVNSVVPLTNLHSTPKERDLTFGKFQDDMTSYKPYTEETLLNNDGRFTNKIITPTSTNTPYVSESGNTFGFDVTGNSNSKAVTLTPHGYHSYNVEMARKPFDSTANFFGPMVQNTSVRLNNQQPHYMMYPPSTDMLVRPLYGTTYPGEEHMMMYPPALKHPQEAMSYLNYLNNPDERQNAYMMHAMDASYQQQMKNTK